MVSDPGWWSWGPWQRSHLLPYGQQQEFFLSLRECNNWPVGTEYLSRTDQKPMSGSETHLQIYLCPQNIFLVFICIVRYQLWKKHLNPNWALWTQHLSQQEQGLRSKVEDVGLVSSGGAGGGVWWGGGHSWETGVTPCSRGSSRTSISSSFGFHIWGLGRVLIWGDKDLDIWRFRPFLLFLRKQTCQMV
jgi:hypothetical protein